jgi:hypothetical protein
MFLEYNHNIGRRGLALVFPLIRHFCKQKCHLPHQGEGLLAASPPVKPISSILGEWF